ncbi:IS110 family transposase [Streptomyces hygroscopicus]|nr:IS110 family transposase [Streptomyces hygroscopicus]
MRYIAGLRGKLTVLMAFDQDLAAEATRTSNRIRGPRTRRWNGSSGRA